MADIIDENMLLHKKIERIHNDLKGIASRLESDANKLECCWCSDSAEYFLSGYRDLKYQFDKLDSLFYQIESYFNSETLKEIQMENHNDHGDAFND